MCSHHVNVVNSKIHCIHKTSIFYPVHHFFQLEDHEYKALDPKDIRLPPPMPPSERLLAAVEAFYSPPSHDRPRNRLVSLLW